MSTALAIKKLSEMLSIQNGYAFDSKLFSFEQGMPLIRIRDLQNGIKTVIKYTGAFSDKYLVKSGDLLIGMDGEFRCYEWQGGPALLNQRVCRLENFGNELHPRYLFYGLNRHLKEIEDSTGFATVKHISSKQILNIEFPVPSLTEQQRIVGILDKAFAATVAAKINTERNREGATAISKSVLEAALKRKGDGWINTTIGEQITLQRGFDITKKDQKPGNIPVVSSGGIKSTHTKAMAKGPGVVMGRKGTLGKVYYVEGDYWPHDTTLWVKEYKGNYPRFVYYFLSQLDVMHLDSGAANPALNRNLVHPIKTAWPPVWRQEEIAKTIDLTLRATDVLTTVYGRKLTALDELRQSILTNAFSGKL